MSDLHGVVYTKDWIANLILDIAGYTTDKQLWNQVIAESKVQSMIQFSDYLAA